MKVRKRDILELSIDKMAYGGQGIARLDGFVIFVKGGMPGDRLTAQVFKKKKDYAEARMIELIEPSPDRVQAPCPYSGYCGGCQWQSVRYERQLDYKKEHIEESMKHIGALKDVVVRDVVPSENKFAYRNKMEFSFSDRRWFLPQEMDRRETEGGFALGLHVPGTFYKVIDIDACLLQQERGNEILQEVKEYVRGCGIPVYGLKTHEGFWRFLAIRYSTAFDEWMVNLVTSEERPEAVQPLADALLRKFGQIKSIINNITGRKASIAVGESEIVLAGQRHIEDKIGPYTFQISPNSFFQTNSPGAQKLYQTVVDYAQFKGNEMVIDLYSGTGTIPVFLASRVQAVTGIEISETAVQDARKNCKENSIDNCRFICGDIREKLPAITHKPDVLIIDPPRAGMHKDVLARVLALSPEKIIYVSCNPATMARDIGQMIQNYQVVEIQPVDMFPHTYHIEAVAKLRHRKKG
ncbi:MAG: 23S rRNA (uracil(1939)-C(5))-methyltransferase RlmD [Deltaproteobacteria bacterium]|nr:23S rRNA (uracil(1939)-C(5))-methyltransferase RlmD [Deltaproteobacteria bacterium]